eukprot:1856603-Pleurochrysis_carterae.AAC.1
MAETGPGCSAVKLCVRKEDLVLDVCSFRQNRSQGRFLEAASVGRRLMKAWSEARRAPRLHVCLVKNASRQ